MAANTKDKKNIKYIGKDFSELKSNLYSYIKSYYPETYGDFTQGTPGELLIDTAAYVGDIMNYYLDYQFGELLDPSERRNAIIMAQKLFGYTPKVVTPSRLSASISFVIPAIGDLGEEVIDTRYLPILKSGAVLETKNISPSVRFTTLDDINFNTSLSFNYTPYKYDGDKIISYLIESGVEAISGQESSYTYTITEPVKYLKLQLPETNISDIISVVDGDENSWYEVPSLATDIIYYEDFSINLSTRVVDSTLKRKRTPKRFYVEIDENNYTYICFGSGIEEENDEEFIPNPDNINKNWFDEDTSVNPENFLKTKTFGQAPTSNITVTYRVNNGYDSNIPSGVLSNVINTEVYFSVTGLDNSTKNNVISSVSCNNKWPAYGGKKEDTIEEIKNNSKNNFLSQNRCITKQDYESRIYSMPPKYGAVSKVRVIKNNSTDENNISIYLLSKDNDNKLAQCGSLLQENIKSYLSDYRMLTDKIIIKNGNILNIQVNFKIIAEPNYQKNDVLLRCANELKKYFNVDDRVFGEKIIKSRLYKLLAAIPGVQSIINVNFNTVTGGNYSNYFFDIESLYDVNSGIYYLPDNVVYEIKFLDRDIIGQVSGVE